MRDDLVVYLFIFAGENAKDDTIHLLISLDSRTKEVTIDALEGEDASELTGESSHLRTLSAATCVASLMG